MEIRKQIEECLNNIGVFLDENENVMLADVIEDSLMFVSMIIEIEQNFGIEIQDEYLLPDRLTSLQDLETLIRELITTKIEKN